MARKKKLKRRRIGTGSEYSPESSSEGSDGPTYDAETKFMKLLGEVDKQLKQKNEAPTYAAYFTYLQSSRGGSKSFAEGKYSTQIALNYIKFASSRVGDNKSGCAFVDHCLTSAHLLSIWVDSLTHLSLASHKCWLSRLGRFVVYRSSLGSFMDPQHALVVAALSQVKKELLLIQQQLKEKIRAEYAEKQSVEALMEAKQWTTFENVLQCHQKQKVIFLKIIKSQSAQPKSQMDLRTRTWCLGFVASSLYVLLSSARCRYIVTSVLVLICDRSWFLYRFESGGLESGSRAQTPHACHQGV